MNYNTTVHSWFETMFKRGQVHPIAPNTLLKVFQEYGCALEIDDKTRKGLGYYSNKARANSMRTVWGNRFEAYKNWAKKYVSEYEERSGKPLPALGGESGSKTSGLIQFFGEATAFAWEALPYDIYKLRTDTRLFNGTMWSLGLKDERRKIPVPVDGKEVETRISSVPPRFPIVFWSWLIGGTTDVGF